MVAHIEHIVYRDNVSFAIAGAKKISAFTVNLTYNLEPVYGLLMAFIFFNENKLFHSQFYIGLSLIILSIVLHSFLILKERKKLSAL